MKLILALFLVLTLTPISGHEFSNFSSSSRNSRDSMDPRYGFKPMTDINYRTTLGDSVLIACDGFVDLSNAEGKRRVFSMTIKTRSPITGEEVTIHHAMTRETIEAELKKRGFTEEAMTTFFEVLCEKRDKALVLDSNKDFAYKAVLEATIRIVRQRYDNKALKDSDEREVRSITDPKQSGKPAPMPGPNVHP